MMKNEIDDAVVNTCLKIIKEPLIYFSEADVQQLLTEELRKIPVLGRLFLTKVHRGEKSETFYKTSLIHREYGGGGGKRIDIVVFDKEEVEKIDNPNLTCNDIYLKPSFAFELGTEKSTNTEDHLNNDIIKLMNIYTERKKRGKNFNGYIIHFFKDITQSASRTKTREKTEKETIGSFKSVFKKKYVYDNSNIKILPLIIRILRKQKRIRGKLEIYNGAKWNAIDISKYDKISTEIKKILA